MIKIVTIALTISILSFTFAVDISGLTEERVYAKFEKFKAKYNRNYATIQETLHKYSIFKTNYLNALQLRDNSMSSNNVGITEFMDLTPEEFQEHYLKQSTTEDKDIIDIPQWNYKQPPVVNNETPEGEGTLYEEIKQTETKFLSEEQDTSRKLQSNPSSYDWRSKGVVSGVLNQGACGGCWAFNSLAAVESAYARKYNKLIAFSPQQIIDCNQSGFGCSGGTIMGALSYLKSYGAQPLSSYPYKQKKGYCNYNSKQGIARVASYYRSNTSDEASIASMLFNAGPLAININASSFQYYKGGIFNPSSCSNSVNHGVTIVGYGQSNGSPYWIVKNSWGSQWGEAGYFRIYRGRKLCGMTSTVVSVVVK